MTKRSFINNTNINESNSLVDLTQQLNPNFEDEVNLIDHSLYYNDEEFMHTVEHLNGALSMLNLNCGGLAAKFDKLKLFLAKCNNTSKPINIITLQETHFSPSTDISYFEIPDYTLIQDLARINTFGGVAIYVHSSLSYTRLPIDQYKQNSLVYESIFIETYLNHSKHNKYIFGTVYRRPNEIVDDLHTFIDEFTETIHNIHQISKKAYINGDFNIDLLKLNTNNHYNTFL